MKLVREHINEGLNILRGPTDEEIDKDLEGMTPEEMLMAGAKHGVLRAVKKALESGADVHADNDWALRRASENGHAEVVKALLDAGANVHAGGDAALRWASQNGHVEVVKILLDAGANVHALDDYALRWAKAYGHTEVLKVLKDHIAKKRVKESLNEKFVEDSDPISDMGIGLEVRKKKLKEKYKWEFIQQKDSQRIISIINKSKGDHEKEEMYARNMAKAIEDPRKAYRRYEAAKSFGGEEWEVTLIFLKRALELNKFL